MPKGFALMVRGIKIGNGGARKKYAALSESAAQNSVAIVAEEINVREDEIEVVELKREVEFVTDKPMQSDRTRI